MLNDLLVRYAGVVLRATTPPVLLADKQGFMQTAPQSSLRLALTGQPPALVDPNAPAEAGTFHGSDWPSPTMPPALQPGEVHIWRLDLTEPGLVVPALNMLVDDERDRAGRYRSDGAMRAFAISRASLRFLLGIYEDVPSDEIELSYGASGKPYASQAEAAVQFNVSHSHGLGLIAFTRGNGLGVDIEYCKVSTAIDVVAQTFFSPEEAQPLARMTGGEKQRAFFNLWTRHEALVKATGTGLRYRVEEAAITDAWSVADLEPAENYAGAIATRESDVRIHQFVFRNDWLRVAGK